VIVLDSSLLCAWHNERDVHHSRARDFVPRFLEGNWGRGLLLDYVFLEVVTVLLARRGQESAFEASRRLMEARELDLVFGAHTFAATVETFRSQPGRELSFTDAAIAALARQRDAAVATFDAGFHSLPDLEVLPKPETVQEI
jgi:predicted nucleic acid-binding protein